MRGNTQWLLAALGGAVVLWALSRTQRGQVAAVDSLEEVTVTAKKIGGTLAAATDSVVAGAKAVAAAIYTPKGIRNNNPGNIEWIENAKQRWHGMVARDGRFGVFDSPGNGVRAIGGELRASFRKGQNTVRAIINEWAPPSENNTDGYVRAVARELQVDPNESLSIGQVPSLAAAIIRHENGTQPYAFEDIQRWVVS